MCTFYKIEFKNHLVSKLTS